MEKNKEALLEQYRKHANDVGSCEVQVIIDTFQILALTEHLKVHRKDKHSRRGITLTVSKRQKCLKYIKRNNLEGYKKLIASLGLRH